ncbi:LysR family transcriptional regulator [Paraburkholderia strydomiana]|uniref:LysR family transcriptional regulator n=1 Tax=Paraburkholderia strydomiana TaxID=1245417 RepID=UPI001BE858DD|nr:LysR family transcriptional regulator [Paraburkholderia strydomiana]MBT2792742.1 LysR family transcriptional regulator [Paraburkholderia strydomiana]
MQIDFLGMQAFLSIVESGGFQPAAAQLNLSQTAISHRIRKLEEGLGVRLLARTTRELTLTDAGRALLPRVRSAMRELEGSYDTLRQHRSSAPQWLTFACLPTLATSHIPNVLKRFAEAYPGIAVRMFDNSIAEIAELVDSESAAFGISVNSPTRFNLAIKRFAKEPFALVCPLGHRLLERDVVRWDDLIDDTLIRISLHAGNSTTIDDALGNRRTEFRWGYETQHTGAAIDFVRAGLGLTVVPCLAATSYPGVVALPLVEPQITRCLATVMRPENLLAPSAVALREMIIEDIDNRLAAFNASLPQPANVDKAHS